MFEDETEILKTSVGEDDDRTFWTVYDGPGGRQLMRSRTEAFAAAWFDLHKMQWVYEPKRHATGWLPDFWLPQTRFLFDVKGGNKISSDDKETIRKAAHILRGTDPEADGGIGVGIWLPQGSRAWQLVRPDASRFKMEPFEAFLCAKCEQWTLGWYICQTCKTDTGFILEHTGRNFVRDHSSFFGERDCLMATKFFYASEAKEIEVIKIPDLGTIRPCGIPGEESYNEVTNVSNVHAYQRQDADDDDDWDEDEDAAGDIVYYLKVEQDEVGWCL